MGIVARRWQRGYILLDLLIALLIGSLAVLLLLGGVALAARTARGVRERAVRQVEARSHEAQSRPDIFSSAAGAGGAGPQSGGP